jgi:hypothetical protein
MTTKTPQPRPQPQQPRPGNGKPPKNEISLIDLIDEHIQANKAGKHG